MLSGRSPRTARPAKTWGSASRRTSVKQTEKLERPSGPRWSGPEQKGRTSITGKRERETKRKLQHFLNDLALLGSLQGFKYFQPWLRGKEELLLTVVNEDLVSVYSPSLASGSSSPVPGDPEGPQSPPQLSKKHIFLGRKFSEEHLLPASPSEGEIAIPEVNCTLFLLAGYIKYGRPYAWIRSNHERLVNIGGADSMVKDTPMKLKSITDWQTRGVRVWDVVSELVCLCTVPSPSNPFALDMRYVKSLPAPERFLVTGALMSFLEMYVVYGDRDELHYDKVLEEVQPLRRLHVQSLLEQQRLRKPSMHDFSR
uniref:Si:dkey-19b23.7 n=1 Tax=Oryzias latipes TaxID=8090 RepID=A0A3P9IXJ8_ORYLA